jgi:hypothetical protein
MQAFCWRS